MIGLRHALIASGPVAIAVMPPSNHVRPRRLELAATPTIG